MYLHLPNILAQSVGPENGSQYQTAPRKRTKCPAQPVQTDTMISHSLCNTGTYTGPTWEEFCPWGEVFRAHYFSW